jgi:cytochrome c oxidase assembly protein subunit 11
MSDLARRNRRVALWATAMACGMVGMAFAAVPLYELFCRTTGFGGTPMVATSLTKPVAERTVIVRFNADMHGNLPWRFQPLQNEVKVRLGEEMVVWYRATNRSQRPIVGTSTYNVTPDIAGPFFNKLQCFCFTEQLLTPDQSIDMPVSFFIDPDMANDRRYDGVHTITLSYTFFEARTERARQLLDNLPPASVKQGGSAARPAAISAKGG